MIKTFLVIGQLYNLPKVNLTEYWIQLEINLTMRMYNDNLIIFLLFLDNCKHIHFKYYMQFKGIVNPLNDLITFTITTICFSKNDMFSKIYWQNSLGHKNEKQFKYILFIFEDCINN